MLQHRIATLTLIAFPPAMAANADQVAFPHFGLSIAAPPGDHRSNPQSFDMVASWLLYDGDDAASADAFFQLTVNPLRGRSPEQLVALLAKPHQAAPIPSALKLTGQPAMEFTVRLDARRHVRRVAATVDSRFIVATYVALGDPRRNDDFEAWLSSLQVHEPAPPDRHLLPLQGAAPIAGSDLVFGPLAPMRPLGFDEATRTTEYGVQNYRDDASEAMLTIMVTDRPKDETFDRTINVLNQSISKTFALAQEIELTPVEGAAAELNRCSVAYSQPLKMPRTRDPHDDRTVHRCFIIARGSPGEALFFQFEIHAKQEQAIGAYAAAFDAMARSIRNGDAYHGAVDDMRQRLGPP